MALRNDQWDWGGAMRLLHWAIALGVIGLLAVGWWMGDLPNGPRKIEIYKLHKSVGLTVLALMTLRIALRLAHRRRPTPPAMPAWQQRAADASHLAMYLLLLAMPLSGWLYNSASNFPLKWFELFRVPALSGRDETLKAISGAVHEYAAIALAALVCLHVAAALKHHFVDRDGVLRSMLPFASARPADPSPRTPDPPAPATPQEPSP
ncbi:MAG: cytochrome b [Xanthomonadaceae bacterium]|jgi:cytochrome b561|nr:cytochrome b [Xanthomonadaceae bacterium]